MFLLVCGFSTQETCVFLAFWKQWRNSQKKTLSQKNDSIFHNLIRLKFQWYRCKSGMAKFTWRATLNYYAYSPFKSEKDTD